MTYREIERLRLEAARRPAVIPVFEEIRKEAFQRGFQQGFKQGLALGRLEERKATAAALFTMGLPLEQIAMALRTTQEEVLLLLEKE